MCLVVWNHFGASFSIKSCSFGFGGLSPKSENLLQAPLMFVMDVFYAFLYCF
jgi:hypothetical protein